MPKFLEDVIGRNSQGNEIALSKAIFPPLIPFPIKTIPYYYNNSISWTANPLGLKLASYNITGGTSQIYLRILFMTTELTLTANSIPTWLSSQGFTAQNSYYPASGYIHEQWIESGPILKDRYGTIIGVYHRGTEQFGIVYTNGNSMYTNYNEWRTSNMNGHITNLSFF